MIRSAAGRFLGVKSSWVPPDGNEFASKFQINTAGKTRDEVIREAVIQKYDIMKDDVKMRELLGLGENDRPACFDRIRRTYPVRREFNTLEVGLDPYSSEFAHTLESLRFKVKPKTN